MGKKIVRRNFCSRKGRAKPYRCKTKETKKSPTKIAPAVETPKGKGRQKAMLQEETPIRRSPRMRGKAFKDSTMSEMSTKESPM